ncbi:hypothetical protein [uncultured Thermanaerothrix sp.]|uniref:hypothetical protein n=1 Tax=uncultured Thermanaerothrix sp. TaxID=1195149 RepID=UPI0026229D81|nr:hypothetical protein [uncultured Thermanaerothrix sp.]
MDNVHQKIDFFKSLPTSLEEDLHALEADRRSLLLEEYSDLIQEGIRKNFAQGIRVHLCPNLYQI